MNLQSMDDGIENTLALWFGGWRFEFKVKYGNKHHTFPVFVPLHDLESRSKVSNRAHKSQSWKMNVAVVLSLTCLFLAPEATAAQGSLGRLRKLAAFPIESIEEETPVSSKFLLEDETMFRDLLQDDSSYSFSMSMSMDS
jgi:hypothetical protein